MRLKIGELSKLAKCPVVTIRFYEKKGLLSSPERTAGNYRIYTQKDMERLRFILHCRLHGIKLEDIRLLLEIKEKKPANCKLVHEMISHYLEDVQKKIISLNLLKSELEELNTKNQCSLQKCEILENLSDIDECEFCRELKIKQ